MLMPSIGVVEPAMSRAACSMVPSPPNTSSKSTSRGERGGVGQTCVQIRPAGRFGVAENLAARALDQGARPCGAVGAAGLVQIADEADALILSASFFNQHQKFFVAGRAEQR